MLLCILGEIPRKYFVGGNLIKFRIKDVSSLDNGGFSCDIFICNGTFFRPAVLFSENQCFRQLIYTAAKIYGNTAVRQSRFFKLSDFGTYFCQSIR